MWQLVSTALAPAFINTVKLQTMYVLPLHKQYAMGNSHLKDHTVAYMQKLNMNLGLTQTVEDR